MSTAWWPARAGSLVFAAFQTEAVRRGDSLAFNCDPFMYLQASQVRRSRSGAGTRTASSWRRGSAAAAAVSTSSASAGKARSRRKPTGDRHPWTAGRAPPGRLPSPWTSACRGPQVAAQRSSELPSCLSCPGRPPPPVSSPPTHATLPPLSFRASLRRAVKATFRCSLHAESQ